MGEKLLSILSGRVKGLEKNEDSRQNGIALECLRILCPEKKEEEKQLSLIL